MEGGSLNLFQMGTATGSFNISESTSIEFSADYYDLSLFKGQLDGAHPIHFRWEQPLVPLILVTFN